MNIRRIIAVITATVAITLWAAAPSRWEAVAADSAPLSVAVASIDSESIEVAATETGYLYLLLPHRDVVKVFTILGQPISSETVEAGVWRMKIAKRGIYIVKIGSATRRVTI